MPSVRRTRLPASASRSVRRRSEMLSLPRSKCKLSGQRQHFGLERRLYTESAGWVFFYALLVSTLVPAGFRHVAFKNGIDDARMLGCFPIYDLVMRAIVLLITATALPVLKIMCALDLHLESYV